MGIACPFNYCGTVKKEKAEFITDDEKKKDSTDTDKDENKITNDNNIIVKTEIKIDKNYTFRGKSSQLTNSVLVLSKNDGKINKGPFVPNTIEQKNTKEEMESFDEMFDKLN